MHLIRSLFLTLTEVVTGDVVIKRLIDDTKGIAKFCDGGPYHGEEVEFSKQVCKFLGQPLSFGAHLSSVARPGKFPYRLKYVTVVRF
jgi:hypothetical protein